MIDSITIKLEEDQFEILDDSLFDGKEAKRVNGKFFVISAYTRQAQIAKKEGYYFPSITLRDKVVKRLDGTKVKIKILEIQASLPKLLHQTNIFGVDEKDLEPIYFALVNCLEKIHIRATTAALSKAVIKRIDFSLVVKLPDYLGEARQVLKLLANFNYKPHSEFRLREFCDISNGMALKFWNNTQGYVIYDKLGEIIANGYTKIELELIKQIQSKKQKRNVIKFELSLERKQSLEALLRRFIKTKSKDFTLEDVMKKEISQTILLEMFDKIYNKSSMAIVTLSQMQENQLEQYLLSKNLKFQRHGLLYYLVNMTTKIGVGAMWAQLAERLKGGSYDRYKGEISLILVELGDISGDIPNLISYLRKQHQKFDIYKP